MNAPIVSRKRVVTEFTKTISAGDPNELQRKAWVLEADGWSIWSSVKSCGAGCFYLVMGKTDA